MDLTHFLLLLESPGLVNGGEPQPRWSAQELLRPYVATADPEPSIHGHLGLNITIPSVAIKEACNVSWSLVIGCV